MRSVGVRGMGTQRSRVVLRRSQKTVKKQQVPLPQLEMKRATGQCDCTQSEPPQQHTDTCHGTHTCKMGSATASLTLYLLMTSSRISSGSFMPFFTKTSSNTAAVQYWSIVCNSKRRTRLHWIVRLRANEMNAGNDESVCWRERWVKETRDPERCRLLACEL